MMVGPAVVFLAALVMCGTGSRAQERIMETPPSSERYMLRAKSGGLRPRAIYHDNDIRESYEVADVSGMSPAQKRSLERALSSVALITHAAQFEETATGLRLATQDYAIELSGSNQQAPYPVCAPLDNDSARPRDFHKQRVGGICTGFMVGKSLLATAAHCIHPQKPGKPGVNNRQIRFVFGYRNEKAAGNVKKPRVDFSKVDVYRIRRVLERVHDDVESARFDLDRHKDFALLELEGPRRTEWVRSGLLSGRRAA